MTGILKFITALILISLDVLIKLCEGGCTWPSPFVSSTWRDNTRGVITFGTDTLSGWTITVQGSTVSNWECLDNTYFNTDGTLLIKATDTFVYLGGTWITYLCLSMTQVSSNSYYYYQKHDQDSTGGYERGKFSTNGALTDKATICSATSAVPTAEFHFMVLSGSESASKQYCPPSLLARMDYTHTSAAGMVTCDSSTDNWDVCTNRTIMTFDYGTCPTLMAYSSGGEVYCMMNFTSTYDYTVVFNTDASPTYRFACIVSNSAGTAASMVYNNCTAGQTPTTFATQADGTSIGYKVTMNPIEKCPFLGPSTGSSTEPESGGSIIPIIVGIIVAVLLLAILAAIIIYCLKRKKRRNVEHQDEEKQKIQENAQQNGHIEKVKVEDLDNPALTVNPEKNTLTPLPAKTDASANLPPVLPPIINSV